MEPSFKLQALWHFTRETWASSFVKENLCLCSCSGEEPLALKSFGSNQTVLTTVKVSWCVDTTMPRNHGVLSPRPVEECSTYIYQEVLPLLTIGKSTDDLLLVSRLSQSSLFTSPFGLSLPFWISLLCMVAAVTTALKLLLRFWTFCSGWKIII